MARKISDETWSNWEKLPEQVDENAIKANREEQFITQIRHYKLITPLFGGGVGTKKADEVKIIRETEIRGQLRFWWRAIRGVGTIKEMLQRESEIFGASASENGNKKLGESKVKVFVKIENEGVEISRNNQDIPKYAVFPLENYDVLRKGIEFSLEVVFPISLRTDVEATFWAWETFGGIGGRTRRGFGAIQLLKIDNRIIHPPIVNSVKTFIEDNLKTYLADGKWNVNVPHLSLGTDNFAFSNPSMISNAENSIIVWKNIIDKLHRFRQSPRNATVYNGESNWSEPDAIRILEGERLFNPPKPKAAPYRMPSHPVGLKKKFPRGQLGLPIIFKFKNQDVDMGDPQTQTLQGRNKDAERLSSPLILRPIECSNGAVGIGLALVAPREPLGGVVLKGHRGSVSTELDLLDIASILPMKSASQTETDVVKSFLKTI